MINYKKIPYQKIMKEKWYQIWQFLLKRRLRLLRGKSRYCLFFVFANKHTVNSGGVSRDLWLWRLALMTYERWHVTRNTWHVTHDTWHMTWHLIYFLLLFLGGGFLFRFYYPHISIYWVFPMWGIFFANNLIWSLLSEVSNQDYSYR